MYKIDNQEIFNPASVENILLESIEVKKRISQDEEICRAIAKAAEVIAQALAFGGKLLVCGNGGSAADALHFCGEMVVKFQKERRPVPAIALNADVSSMTASANDLGYEAIFERSVQAFMKPEDVFVGISTSGDSLNVLRATKAAKEIGGKVIALLGKGGGELKKEVDLPIIVPSNITARIQESHICIIHAICELVEKTLE